MSEIKTSSQSVSEAEEYSFIDSPWHPQPGSIREYERKHADVERQSYWHLSRSGMRDGRETFETSFSAGVSAYMHCGLYEGAAK